MVMFYLVIRFKQRVQPTLYCVPTVSSLYGLLIRFTLLFSSQVRGNNASTTAFYRRTVRPLLRNMTAIFAADAAMVQNTILPLLPPPSGPPRTDGAITGGQQHQQQHQHEQHQQQGGVSTARVDTLHELNDSVQMLALRARFVYELYEAALACGHQEHVPRSVSRSQRSYSHR